MRQFQAVIFDMDGLLLDTERIAQIAFGETCGQFGLGPSPDVFFRCVGTNDADCQRVLEAAWAGVVDHLEFLRAWDERLALATLAESIPVKAGAVELVAYVAGLPLPMAVATSTRTERAERKLASAGLLSYLRHVVGGDQVDRSKPHPDIYLRAAQLLAARPEACLALEDSENGVRAASAAGMTVVQIPDLVQPAESATPARLVLGSLHDLIGYDFDTMAQQGVID